MFHQASFINKELFNKIGFYDERYQIVGDYEFFIRALKNKASFKYIPQTFTNYDPNGISSTMSDTFLAERCTVVMRHYMGLDYVYNFIKYLYYKNKKYIPNFIVKIQQDRLANKPKI